MLRKHQRLQAYIDKIKVIAHKLAISGTFLAEEDLVYYNLNELYLLHLIRSDQLSEQEQNQPNLRS